MLMALQYIFLTKENSNHVLLKNDFFNLAAQ